MHIILINESKTNKMYFFFRRFLILVKFDSFHHLYFTFFVHLTKYVKRSHSEHDSMHLFLLSITCKQNWLNWEKKPKKEEEEMKQTKIFAQSCSRFITGMYSTHTAECRVNIHLWHAQNNFTYLIESNWSTKGCCMDVMYSYNSINNDYRNEKHQR